MPAPGWRCLTRNSQDIGKPRNTAMPETVMDLTLVIPVRNEAENVASLLGEIRTAMGDSFAYEVIYVDDGSTDDTAKIVSSWSGIMPELRLLRHQRSYGQSAAVCTGVRAARAEWIATLDGDGQNDPADIPALWAVAHDPQAPAGLGLVGGHRVRRQDSWSKRMSSRIANRVRARLLGDATPDTGCGLKLFRRSVFLDLPAFDHMHRFLPALMRRQGAAIVSVPVNHRPRHAGRSNYGIGNRLWVGLADMLGVMWLQRRPMVPALRNMPDQSTADPAMPDRSMADRNWASQE